MHEIQQYIVKQLVHQEVCRYRDIKPKEVEGNLFTYHLRRLIQENIIEKCPNGYRLTGNGLRLVDNLSLQSMQPRIQPKIATLVACQNNNQEWLLYRRSKQPFLGKIGFPYGKIHLGERIAEAADRELVEKTGINAKLVHVGDAYLTVDDGTSLITHMLFHIFYGVEPSGELQQETAIGSCFWQSEQDIVKEQTIPGFTEILRCIKSKQRWPFFIELSVSFPSAEDTSARQ